MRKLIQGILILAALAAPACYSTGLQFRDGVRSVAIPVFHNETYVRGVELDMTDRIRLLLLDRSDVRLVDDPARADATIRGRITRVHFPVLVGGNQPRILEGAATMAVSAELVETRTGRVLASVQGDDRAEFTTPLSEDRRTALADLVDLLAWRVLLGLSARASEVAP